MIKGFTKQHLIFQGYGEIMNEFERIGGRNNGEENGEGKNETKPDTKGKQKERNKN